MVFKRKLLRRKRPMRKSRRMAKPSKPLVRAIKQVVRRQAETKVINCPTAGSSTVNTVALAYPALSGVQYLVTDVFSCPQGVDNNTGIAAGNRIGDKIQGLGFQMNYYFQTQSNYVVGGTTIAIPWLKLRVMVFEGKSQVANPISNALLFDQNYLNTNTSTLQPFNYDNGFFQRILYDRVFVVKNNSSLAGTIPAQNILRPCGGLFHFKKYISYKKLVQYTDTYAPANNNTKNPLYICISAEIDDASTGAVPSGTTIMTTTGYTRAWFKDY